METIFNTFLFLPVPIGRSPAHVMLSSRKDHFEPKSPLLQEFCVSGSELIPPANAPGDAKVRGLI